MVQYILTPWRDRSELLRVRHQFYGSSSSEATSALDNTQEAGRTGDILGFDGIIGHRAGDSPRNSDDQGPEVSQHQAVARVSMWMQRGNCPHLIEATAMLTAAILSDGEASRAGDANGVGGPATYA